MEKSSINCTRRHYCSTKLYRGHGILERQPVKWC